jgi:nicotinamidase-related amidase
LSRLGSTGVVRFCEFVPEPGEIVATEHWCSSGFANTDLDLQLENHGIHQLIVIGLIASSHVLMLSKPDLVLDVIRKAAGAVSMS